MTDAVKCLPNSVGVLSPGTFCVLLIQFNLIQYSFRGEQGRNYWVKFSEDEMESGSDEEEKLQG